MLSPLKKILLFSVIIIFLVGGGYFVFIRLNSSTSVLNNSTKPLEEEKDWGNISGWFLDDPDLKKGWKNQRFTYDQTHDWINIGLSPTDFPFAAWLRDKKKLSPEEVLNHENEKNLREEWINEEDDGGNITKLKMDIINCLDIWLVDCTTWDNDAETQEAVRKTIKDLKNSSLSNNQQLNSLKDLLENYYQSEEDASDSDSSDEEDQIKIFDTPSISRKNKTSQNYQRILELFQQWEKLEEKPIEENWFGKRHKLTSEEIDWAAEKIKKNNKFKILPADQFYLASIAVELTKETADNILFLQLLDDIQDKEVELVFIPVKNNENHWSLLIYEKNSGFFYHYDINEGINFEYSAPLLVNLLNQMKSAAKSEIDEQWWETFVKNRLGKKREDDYNSGIAVINIIQRIIQLYDSRFRIADEVVEKNGERYTKSRHNLELVGKNLGEFNFSEERKIWQERYSSENKN